MRHATATAWVRRTTIVMVSMAGLGATEAAVLCQKKQKIRIRPEACTAKETLLQDLGALAALGDKVAQVAADASAACSGAPARTVATGGPEGLCGGGCRTFDGNESGCNGAYVVTPKGAVACGFSDGLCLPCNDVCGARFGACQNACDGPPQTCADATRTRFGGGEAPFVGNYPYNYSCNTVRTQAECEKTWHIAVQSGVPASCYWNGSGCYGCGPKQEDDGSCTNSCASFSCADATRTVRDRCRDASDETACNAGWHVGRRDGGLASSCWWDAPENQCRGCGLRHETKGFCTNTCD